jgi:hypothetical protein
MTLSARLETIASAIASICLIAPLVLGSLVFVTTSA